MDKYNTSSEKIFNNNNENIKRPSKFFCKSKHKIYPQLYIYIIVANLLSVDIPMQVTNAQ